MKLNQLTAKELIVKIKQKEVSIKEVLDHVYTRIEETDDRVKGYLSLNKDEAYKKAENLQKIVGTEEEKSYPLLGVPIAVKDNMVIKGGEATCASRILKNFISPYNATVIDKIKESGAVVIGKTNLDEFAMGSSTENSSRQTTKNPWNLERTPGGSSGGAAAVIAADSTVLSLGSDTGGSIRQPAAFCGVVGMKPTYGRVSRYGLIAFASSLDQIGPLTKNVYDTALLLEVISGHDSKDSTSLDRPVPKYTEALGRDLKGKVVGIPKEYFDERIDKEVFSKVKEAIKVLEDLGVSLKEISLPHTKYAVATYYIIATAEASSNLARYDGVQYGHRSEDFENLIDMYKESRTQGFGKEVKRRIMLGTYVLSSGYYDAYYLKAQKVRSLIRKDFEDAFKTCDLIITPTTPTKAFKLGEKTSDPLEMYLTDICTTSANLAGIPGISVPCGFSSDNLPIGLQILGNYCEEESLLNLAFQYEQLAGVREKKPDLF
ncbi:Asp-tRNA(Asn)/Glu-tRNA(Gln) amidotransferase subunit GatA [Candidatus Auribacterota bacterium]